MPETLSNRIKRVVDMSKLTKTEFASRINISQPHLSRLCSGENKPSDRTISDICEKFHINETWLRTGEGEMDAPINQEEELMNWITEIFQSPTDDARRRVIAVLAKLPPEWYQVLVDAALAEAERCKKERGEA